MAKQLSLYENIENELKRLIGEKISDEDNTQLLINQLIRGAEGGREIQQNIEKWIENLKFQLVWLDKEDYSKALIRALWLAPRFAGTDFGSSRQRDMGQIWTDTARGFLGEIAFTKFLLEKFNIETQLDTKRGDLQEFLPSDLKKIKFPSTSWRDPRLKLSIKTTKFNGRWLDIPGAQYEHSDIFVLVKIGILRKHFLAFLKAISFIRDKLFVAAKNLGELDENNAQELWNEIPEFDPIPGYIVGYIEKQEIKFPIHMINFKIRGKKNRRITITQGVGLFTIENIRSLPNIREADPTNVLPIEIEPIIKSYSGQHFFAHSGALKNGEANWRELINKL